MPTNLVWLDFRLGREALGTKPEQLMAMLEAETTRRSIVTHLPADAVRFSDKAKYVFIARDGRDVVWSLYAFFSSFSATFLDIANNQ